MANEAQYYSPIIQAMIESSHNAQHKEDREKQVQQFKDDLQLRQLQQKDQEHRTDNEEKRINNEHDQWAETMEKVHLPQIQAALAQNRIANLASARDALSKGMDPSVFQHPGIKLPPIPGLGFGGGNAGQTPDDMLDIPGVGQVPKKGFRTAQEESDFINNQAAKGAGIKQMAIEQAGEQFKDADAVRSRESERLKQAGDLENRKTELGISSASAERLAKIRDQGETSRTLLNGANHLKGISLMHQLGQDDENGTQAGYAKQLTDSIFNGQSQYGALTADQKRLVTNYSAGTGESVPTNGKDYAEKLNKMGDMQNLINQYRDLATNYSSDSKNGGFKARMENGQMGGLVPKSDLNSKLDSMKASGGQLASFFDQQNRKSDAEILRQVTGAFDPKANTQQNLEKLNQHVQLLNGTARNTFVGMSPDRVNSVLDKRGIVDFGGYKANHNFATPDGSQYAIPEDKVDAFKAAHKDATEQQ